MTGKLPIVVSVPHGGIDCPEEARPSCLLTGIDFAQDGDTWARELYALDGHVLSYVDMVVPRAIVDMNRDPLDRPPDNPDGIIKTRTVQGKQIWVDPSGPEAPVTSELMDRFYTPYHETLHRLGSDTRARLGLDCHTMLAIGPDIGPGAGKPRPLICLGNHGGPDGQQAHEPLSAPTELIQSLREALEQSFQGVQVECRCPGPIVTINDPFRGGYITRHHASLGPLPWVQIELSRALYLPAGASVTAEPVPDDLPRLTDLRNRLFTGLRSVSIS